MKFTALTVTLDEPLSFKVTVRLALAVLSRRLMPLKPASRAHWVGDLAQDGGELGGGAGPHRGVGRLLRLAD